MSDDFDLRGILQDSVTRLLTDLSTKDVIDRAEQGVWPDRIWDALEEAGLTRTLVANMVAGVTEGYTKKLEIVGTGYRVMAKGADLEFALGFSHPVIIPAPDGISFAVESPTRFSVSGIDKQKVGEVAAADVPPTASPIPRSNVFRDDTPEPSLPVDESLRNAPDRDGDRFKVPRIAETGA